MPKKNQTKLVLYKKPKNPKQPKKSAPVQTVPLQQSYALSRGTMSRGDTNQANCVKNYAAMLADPFSYQGEAPCALGYPASNVIPIKKAARFLVTAGESNNAYICLNTVLGATEDTNSIAYTDATYNDSAFKTGIAGVQYAPLTGGIFNTSQLNALGPDKTLARCIYASIRVRPAGAVVDTSGLAVGWQSEVNPDQPSAGDTSISSAQALGNVVTPLFNVTSTTSGIVSNWLPQVYAEGDFIDPKMYTLGEIKDQGGKLWLLLSGVKKAFTFIAEVVAYYEFFTHTNGIALARPSHQDAAAGSRLNEVAGRYRTYQGSNPYVSQLISTTSELVREAAPSVIQHLSRMGVSIATNYLANRSGMPMLTQGNLLRG